jgi:SPP1 gp7 family putative phage head morphogenesis protein
MDDVAVIERVKRVIAQGIEEGWTREKGIDRLTAELIAAGGEPLDCYHSELLWQTGTTTAYMQRRVQQMADPDTVLALPFWRYCTMQDQCVRPNHAALEGFVARYDDPVWNRILPPLGFNCRCTVEPLLFSEAEERLGGKINTPGEQRLPVGAGPDEGFDPTPWAFLRNVESAPEYDEYPEEDEEDEG